MSYAKGEVEDREKERGHRRGEVHCVKRPRPLPHPQPSNSLCMFKHRHPSTDQGQALSNKSECVFGKNIYARGALWILGVFLEISEYRHLSATLAMPFIRELFPSPGKRKNMKPMCSSRSGTVGMVLTSRLSSGFPPRVMTDTSQI